MTLWQAVVLGVVQGLTEFLPVSSSGHLVLFQTVFHLKEPMMAFDIALHGATLAAVCAYFWKDLAEILSDFWHDVTRVFTKQKAPAPAVQPPHAGLWACILISMVPTGIIAVVGKHFFEEHFSQLVFVALRWLIVGTLFIQSRRFQKGQKDLSVVTYGDAFWIGLAQGIALMPGVSRSGITILTGLWLGYRKETAAKFSFLISVPAILAAIAMELHHGLRFFEGHSAQMLAGFITAAVTGYIAIRWLMNVVGKGRFYLFGYYCLAVGLFAFTYLLLAR